MSRKLIYIPGFTLFALLFIWHIWQTVYADIPRGGPLQISGQFLMISLLLGGSVWFWLDEKRSKSSSIPLPGEFRIWAWAIIALLTIQIIWGGITSGLHGGHVYNTFPTMNRNWIPPELFIMEPFYINFIDNAATAQWIHRLFGTLLSFMVIILWIRSFMVTTSFKTKKWILGLFSLILLQYATGVFALIYHVPVPIGLLHQILTVALVGLAVGFLKQTNPSANKQPIT